jgi:hypothetical protein
MGGYQEHDEGRFYLETELGSSQVLMYDTPINNLCRSKGWRHVATSNGIYFAIEVLFYYGPLCPRSIAMQCVYEKASQLTVLYGITLVLDP